MIYTILNAQSINIIWSKTLFLFSVFSLTHVCLHIDIMSSQHCCIMPDNAASVIFYKHKFYNKFIILTHLYTMYHLWKARFIPFFILNLCLFTAIPHWQEPRVWPRLSHSPLCWWRGVSTHAESLDASSSCVLHSYRCWN